MSGSGPINCVVVRHKCIVEMQVAPLAGGRKKQKGGVPTPPRFIDMIVNLDPGMEPTYNLVTEEEAGADNADMKDLKIQIHLAAETRPLVIDFSKSLYTLFTTNFDRLESSIQPKGLSPSDLSKIALAIFQATRPLPMDIITTIISPTTDRWRDIILDQLAEKYKEYHPQNVQLPKPVSQCQNRAELIDNVLTTFTSLTKENASEVRNAMHALFYKFMETFEQQLLILNIKTICELQNFANNYPAIFKNYLKVWRTETIAEAQTDAEAEDDAESRGTQFIPIKYNFEEGKFVLDRKLHYIISKILKEDEHVKIDIVLESNERLRRHIIIKYENDSSKSVEPIETVTIEYRAGGATNISTITRENKDEINKLFKSEFNHTIQATGELIPKPISASIYRAIPPADDEQIKTEIRSYDNAVVDVLRSLKSALEFLRGRPPQAAAAGAERIKDITDGLKKFKEEEEKCMKNLLSKLVPDKILGYKYLFYKYVSQVEKEHFIPRAQEGGGCIVVLGRKRKVFKHNNRDSVRVKGVIMTLKKAMQLDKRQRPKKIT